MMNFGSYTGVPQLFFCLSKSLLADTRRDRSSTTTIMTFYDRYIKGETEQVYQDIYVLGQDAFLPANLPDIEKVLTETFQRVAYNLDIIYTELKNINYLFKTEFEYNFQRPLHKPLPGTDTLLEKLDKAVEGYGFVPLSLKYFYKIVGGVNFVWDYDTNENFMWDMADPIQVASLDDLVNEVAGDDWKENMQDYLSDNENENVFFELAADDLHKDNVSGGPPYSLEITKSLRIDSNFLNEPNETTFINY
jgi:hypothetical protein